MQLTPFSFALNNAPLAGDVPVEDAEGAPEGFLDVLSLLFALPQVPVEQPALIGPVGVPGDLEDVVPTAAPAGEASDAADEWFSDIDAIEAAAAVAPENDVPVEEEQSEIPQQTAPVEMAEVDETEAETPRNPEVQPVEAADSAQPFLEEQVEAEPKADLPMRNPRADAADRRTPVTPEKVPVEVQGSTDAVQAETKPMADAIETDLPPEPAGRATPGLKPRVHEEHLVRPGAQVDEPERERAVAEEESEVSAEAPEGADLPEAVARPEKAENSAEQRRENHRPQTEVRAPEASSPERPHTREAVQHRAVHRAQSEDGAAALARRQFEIVRQVARDIAIRNLSGDVEMRMALSPPNLGTVKLRLRVEDGTVSGSMTTDSAATRHVLQQHTNELREALAKEGLELSSFDVSSESRESREQRRQSPRQSRHHFAEERSEGEQVFETARVNEGRVQGYL